MTEALLFARRLQPGAAHPAPRDRPQPRGRAGRSARQAHRKRPRLSRDQSQGRGAGARARQWRGADRECGGAAVSSATARASARCCRRWAISAATACSNGSITSPPSCTRASARCSGRRAGRDQGLVSRSGDRREVRPCRKGARRRALPARRQLTLPDAYLFVMPRLGREDDRPRPLARPPGVPRADDGARIGRQVLEFEGLLEPQPAG